MIIQFVKRSLTRAMLLKQAMDMKPEEVDEVLVPAFGIDIKRLKKQPLARVITVDLDPPEPNKDLAHMWALATFFVHPDNLPDKYYFYNEFNELVPKWTSKREIMPIILCRIGWCITDDKDGEQYKIPLSIKIKDLPKIKDDPQEGDFDIKAELVNPFREEMARMMDYDVGQLIDHNKKWSRRNVG